MDTEFDFENRIVTTDCISEDGDNELSLRPHSLDEYVGQTKSKEILEIYFQFSQADLVQCHQRNSSKPTSP